MTEQTIEGVADRARDGFFENAFTWRGRLNRARYWRYVLLIIVPIIAIFVISVASQSTAGISIAMLLFFLAAYPGLMIAIRRLHDRDKSGHWIWLFYVAPMLLNGFSNAAEWSGVPVMAFILAIAGFALSVWGFIELGCLKGTQGPNRFGPDPLGG